MLKFDDIQKNQSIMRRRLLIMKSKGLIRIIRTGTGFMGATDFHHKSANTYLLPNFFIY